MDTIAMVTVTMLCPLHITLRGYCITIEAC